MEFTKAPRYTVWLWIFILLTVNGPFTAFAQKSCHSIFFSKSTLGSIAFNKSIIKTSRFKESTDLFWQAKFSKIRSLAEFEVLLNEIHDNTSNMSDFDLSTLQRIDLITTVRQLPDSDLPRLKEIVLEVAARVRYSRHVTPLDAWLFPLHFYFNPKNILLFFHQIKKISEYGLNIADAYSGTYGLRSFNQTFSSAIEKLPSKIQHQAQNEIMRQMSTITLNEEQMSMKNGKLQTPNSRLYRRNLETIASLLTRESIEILKNKLGKSNLGRDQIVAAVDEYYLRIGKLLSSERGNYSFTKVLQAGEIIQKKLFEFLKTDLQYISVYGSFTNGKASLKISDIDIKFSTELLLAITQKTEAEVNKSPFSLFFADMVKRDLTNLPYDFLKFWKNYEEAEIELGEKVLGRSPIQSSELLATLYPPRDYSNNSFDVRWYNPLVLKITRDHIILQLVDLPGDLSLTEISVSLK